MSTAWFTLETASPAETEAFARQLARGIPDGTVVLLHGDLGAGKTVLARGLARELGITEPVTSPTFALVQEYHRPDGRWFFHLDLYRIDGAAAAIAMGIDDYLFRPDAITAVEWPERIAGLLTEPAAALLPVFLEAVDENRRRIRLPDRFRNAVTGGIPPVGYIQSPGSGQPAPAPKTHSGQAPSGPSMEKST